MLILLIAVFFFGGEKLPDMAKGLGKGVWELRRAMEEPPRGRQAPGARTDGTQRQHQQRGTIEADCARWGPVLCRQGERSTAVWHRAWGARVPHRFLLWAYGEQPQEGACRTTRHTRLWHHARTGPTRCPPVPPPSNAPPRRGTPCADRTALVCRRAHPPPSGEVASV